ncbi:MAG TPA: hypothetical protein GX399_19000 [Xanthomonadaceae bacterium]|nr:hypothetical protein [Xanthomonadaceae bacterium]
MAGVNIRQNCLEIHRDNQEGQYRFETFLRRGDTVCPLARPDHVIAVADLLP